MRGKIVLSGLCTLLAFGVQVAFAAPPAAINLHGQLLSSSGAPVTGARAYTVQFHDASTGGNLLGTALTGTVDVSGDGLFNLSVEPPAAILSAPEVWYSLGVDTDEPADSVATDDLFPSRIQVYSVPFALQAGAVDASGVGNGTVDNTELDRLDGVTSNVQDQIDAIDTSGIATNAAAITQLQTDVAAKADSTDVYTKTESDTNFVAKSGSTMTGALGVDTINEATTNAGVTADGVGFKDSYIALTPIAAPGVTTGKLYNVGGSLFFNGAALGGTTVNKDAINNSGTLGFDWLDAEVDNALTITGGTVNNDSFSAISDLGAESAIGSGMGQVAAGDHSHNLQNLGGAVTDAQVPDSITISGGTVNNNAFSAISDLTAESAIGTSAGQVAAGDHSHNLQNLGGAVTDAQVPDNITISGVRAADDTAAAPAVAYANDTNTGVHRPAADQLALVTNGTARLSVDNVEVNLLNNIVEIVSGSAPGTTTNKLYNSSGNLFWNGTQLNTGGGGADTDTLQWTSGYVFGAASTVYKHTMTKAGTITSFEIYGVYFSGSSGLIDLKKNSSSILSGGAATLGNGTLASPTLSSTAFSAGDVLELYLDLDGGELLASSVSITVQYP